MWSHVPANNPTLIAVDETNSACSIAVSLAYTLEQSRKSRLYIVTKSNSFSWSDSLRALQSYNYNVSSFLHTTEYREVWTTLAIILLPAVKGLSYDLRMTTNKAYLFGFSFALRRSLPPTVNFQWWQSDWVTTPFYCDSDSRKFVDRRVLWVGLA